ncbi:MAG TPA: tetratricopeptide repeat protein [Longimicrobiales bacterium]|nr:tetratricopeptide repeat protein [Longimicrobiales bacterium]
MSEDALARALAFGEDERWDEMVEVLLEALRDEPDDPYLLGWLGVAERERGNDGAAYEYFKRCVAEDPLDPQLLALAGSGLAAFDDPEAETALRAAALSGPDMFTTRLQYGAYLARAGLYREALEQLRAAIALDVDDPVGHSELATALALQGEVSAAIDRMEHALTLAPEDGWNRALLGLLYAEADDMERAAEHLLMASSERVDDPEVQAVAALAAMAAGWEDAAHEALARAGYAAEEPVDARLVEEAEDRLASGADAARGMLRDALGPSMLRERLMEPL